MSYTLSFRFRTSDHADEDAIREYFQTRRNFECSDAQASYGNETTGVYFFFDFRPSTPDIEDTKDLPLSDPAAAPVSIDVNCYRPHYFALEAERELTPFVQHFNLVVSDETGSEYKPEGFLQDWNTSNLDGYRVALSFGQTRPFSLPTATLESIWRWNFTRDERQQVLVEPIYVPRVFLFNVAGALKTGIVWGDDAGPILMPEVDLVLAPRDQGLTFFSMQELLPILSSYPRWMIKPKPGILSLAAFVMRSRGVTT